MTTNTFPLGRAILVTVAICALIALSLLTGCAGAPTPIPEPDSHQAQFYAERCGACHPVPHPKRHSMAEWGPMLDVMQLRMTERGMTPMDADERQRIEAYLEAHAR